MIGELLDGQYEVLRLIGEGGMGAVYEARNNKTGQRCAVKVINDEAVAKDEVLIQRFEREAYAAQKVRSPNIVEILAAGHDASTSHPYMVMEMLDGENALQVLKRIGPMPPELALRVGIQTCEGLASAHEAGVVHRDIKPANLFLADAGNGEHVVKLLDFGVAKFKMDQASESDNESLTRTGSMLGSPMYMSPEQARGLKTIDHRADIWSLGIVMHQLLSGRVPHQDIDGLGELIITICSEPPPPVSASAPWLSRRISEVIAGALKLSTSERYQSAREFADAMRRCLADGETTIRSSTIVALTDEERSRRPTDEQAPAPEAPAAAPSVPPPAPAPAPPPATSGPKFVPLSQTVAMDDLEEEMRKAKEELQRLESEPPPTQALPDMGGSRDQNLAATVALPMDLGAFALPPEAQAAPQSPAPKNPTPKPVASPASPAARAPRDPERDERALAKHREAQRAAIEAARLGPSDEGGSGRVILAIVVGVLIGGGGLAAYYFKVRGSGAPTPTASVSAEPAPSPPPAPAPSPPPSPSGSASATPAAEASTRALKVSPPYATFAVDGKAVTPRDGVIELDGAPGTSHQVRVAVGAAWQLITVKVTETGLEPDHIDFKPAPNAPKLAPPKPPGAPAPSPPKPKAPPK